MKQKKMVLLAGLPAADQGRCQGMIDGVIIHTADDQRATLSFLRRNPEIAVIHVDQFDKDILQKIAGSGYTGKVIPVTNSCKLMRSSSTYIAPRDVPDAVDRELTM
ncbi:MAG: hypothetical protein A2937_00505 [Candidatus Yonathbacteria bacterium RIFCSPLOWO2_01_FULL_47_33b]|uniref:Uncharacterized protein n=1 Tax=Candidatus Yonathbacteria bacterium RIFCSPLOWO2_01_FULL_47_33b TaxID=1802727 RepID=A0A1G2SG98_9BACT|nr:MAG: hypothetical protein A2937_00505 [Candidatus Yonathbacteria bacterium RIFCSPLOWO2_01_FULL_47_33b]